MLVLCTKNANLNNAKTVLIHFGIFKIGIF